MSKCDDPKNATHTLYAKWHNKTLAILTQNANHVTAIKAIPQRKFPITLRIINYQIFHFPTQR